MRCPRHALLPVVVCLCRDIERDATYHPSTTASCLLQLSLPGFFSFIPTTTPFYAYQVCPSTCGFTYLFIMPAAAVHAPHHYHHPTLYPGFYLLQLPIPIHCHAWFVGSALRFFTLHTRFCVYVATFCGSPALCVLHRFVRARRFRATTRILFLLPPTTRQHPPPQFTASTTTFCR